MPCLGVGAPNPYAAASVVIRGEGRESFIERAGFVVIEPALRILKECYLGSLESGTHCA